MIKVGLRSGSRNGGVNNGDGSGGGSGGGVYFAAFVYLNALQINMIQSQ